MGYGGVSAGPLPGGGANVQPPNATPVQYRLMFLNKPASAKNSPALLPVHPGQTFHHQLVVDGIAAHLHKRGNGASFELPHVFNVHFGPLGIMRCK